MIRARLAFFACAFVAGCGGPVAGGPTDGTVADFAAPQDFAMMEPPPPPPPPRASVLTQHNDLSRTGANLGETRLTPAKVKAGFGKLFTLEVDDEIYAQPLFVPDLNVAGKGVHDVVLVATVNNSLYAFDANDGAALWKLNLGPAGVPVTNADVGSNCRPYRDFSGHIGTVGTPVIDPTTGTLYVVARTKEPQFVQRLHAVDITSGSERTGSPVLISASVPGNGVGGEIAFDPRVGNQRAGLLLSGGAVVIAWSSHCDTGDYHGWALAYDAKTLQQVGVFNSTPTGSFGGIWQAGGAPIADSAGNIYVAVANGDHDGIDNFAQSLIKLAPRTLALRDWFTPAGADAMNGGDLDFGSSGTILLPGTDVLVAGTKTGELYVTHAASLGKSTDDDSQIVQKILVSSVPEGTEETNHLHGGPIFYDGPQGKWLYVWAENDFLRAYAFDGQRFADSAVSQSLVKPSLGMPGGMLALSANGAKDGIVWATHPTDGDANQAVRHGILRAFDATDLTKELWNSTAVANDDFGQFAKFVAPTVVEGKVYMATFSGRVVVYGLK